MLRRSKWVPIIISLVLQSLWHQVDGQGSPTDIVAIDSDYLLLREASSTLPFPAGNGVFAKQDIPAGTIVCEYRGPVVEAEQATRLPSTKAMNIDLNGVDHTIIGNTICAMINDCANILGREIILDSSGQEVKPETFAPYEGYSYNVNFLSHLGKMFAVSSRDIKEGEELFASYGG